MFSQTQSVVDPPHVLTPWFPEHNFALSDLIGPHRTLPETRQASTDVRRLNRTVVNHVRGRSAAHNNVFVAVSAHVELL